MLTEEQKNQECERAPEEKRLEDAEYDRINELDQDGFAALTEDQRAAYFSTYKWHYGQRQRIDVGSIYIGDRKIDDVLSDQP
jgi:hypothetical protein